MKLIKLLNKRSEFDGQLKFISSIEGLGDILSYEATKKASSISIVKKGLRNMDEIFISLFDLQKSDPERFDRMILSSEFFSIHKKSKREAGLRLSFQPDEYLPSFTAIVNQFIRLFEASLSTENDEIALHSVYSLVYALAEVSKRPKNDIFVRFLLKTIARIGRDASKKESPADRPALIDWYPDIVFNRIKQGKNLFCLEYLTVFNQYFFFNLRTLVDEDLKGLYRDLIGYLVDGIHLLDEDRSVWTYAHLLLHQDGKKYLEINKNDGVEGLIRKLENKSTEIRKEEDLDNWFDEFRGLRKTIYSHLDKKNKKEANLLTSRIKESLRGRFLMGFMWDMLFSLCAYAIRKNKLEYIFELWEAKQPGDAGASWGGADLYPGNLEELIRYYFRDYRRWGGFELTDGHHGLDIYRDQYFLLFLSRYLEKFNPAVMTVEGSREYPEISGFRIPFNDIQKLKDLEYEAERLIPIALELISKRDLFEDLNIKRQPHEDLIKEKLVPFLNRLISDSKSRLKEASVTSGIADNKVSDFFDGFVKSFRDQAVIRRLFMKYKLFNDLTSQSYAGEKKVFGINKLEAREMFLDEWYISYSGREKHYAEGMASAEDKLLFEKIVRKCKRLSFESLEDQLVDLGKVSFAMVSSRFALHSLDESRNFIEKWQVDKSRQLGLPGFIGWYKVKNVKVPVFEVSGDTKALVFLSDKKLGYLNQLSPFDKKDDKGQKKDLFRIRFEDMARSEDMRKELLEKPPEWLVRVGGEQERIEYLKRRVLLQIHERFELKFNEEFEGYSVLLKEE